MNLSEMDNPIYEAVETPRDASDREWPGSLGSRGYLSSRPAENRGQVTMSLSSIDKRGDGFIDGTSPIKTGLAVLTLAGHSGTA